MKQKQKPLPVELRRSFGEWQQRTLTRTGQNCTIARSWQATGGQWIVELEAPFYIGPPSGEVIRNQATTAEKGAPTCVVYTRHRYKFLIYRDGRWKLKAQFQDFTRDVYAYGTWVGSWEHHIKYSYTPRLLAKYPSGLLVALLSLDPRERAWMLAVLK